MVRLLWTEEAVDSQTLWGVVCRNNYSSRLEEDPFPSGGGPTADYAFMLFFGAVVLWVRAVVQPDERRLW